VRITRRWRRAPSMKDPSHYHAEGWGSLEGVRFLRRFGAVGSQSGTTNEPVTSSFAVIPSWPCKEAPALTLEEVGAPA
jgi:hypothetical protein